MSDAKCPYCNREIEIIHDDGYGYEENILHEQQCCHCDKTFTYRTQIMIYYETQKAPCLNGSKHNYKPTITYPLKYTTMECIACGETRRPTKTEFRAILST